MTFKFSIFEIEQKGRNNHRDIADTRRSRCDKDYSPLSLLTNLTPIVLLHDVSSLLVRIFDTL